MKLTLRSTTINGQWAFALIIMLAILTGLKFFTMARHISLPLLTASIFGIGIIVLALAAIAFIKENDKSVMTFITLLSSLVVVIWIILQSFA